MKIIKKLISVVLSITITSSLFIINSNASSTGNIGVNETNITWSLDGDGNLTISGSGKMKNMNNYFTFKDEAKNIKNVVIEEGVVNIGSYIFSMCEKMRSISIPLSVTEIGENAFAEASSLNNVYYEGTKSQWEDISISSGNDYLLKAKINYTEEAHICTFGVWKITNEPTCVADGFRIRKCECGNEEKATIPATGIHKFEWKTTVEPQCLTDGEEKQFCKDCSLTGETRKIDKTGHKPGEWSDINKPTCTDKGLKAIQCEECGENLDEMVIAPTGHSFGEWKTITKETEDHNGEEKRVCKTCKFTEYRIVDNINPNKGKLMGDANDDGVITALDARLILQYVAGLVKIEKINFGNADVNNDKDITALDARYVLQVVAGLKEF